MTERCEHCGGRLDRPGLFACIDGHPAPTLSQRIAKAIEYDLTHRRGLRQAWERIDADTQDEIRDEWGRVVDQLLAHNEEW